MQLYITIIQNDYNLFWRDASSTRVRPILINLPNYNRYLYLAIVFFKTSVGWIFHNISIILLL